MKGTFALLSLLGAALASPMPQGVTSAIAPSSSTPAGCSSSSSGSFQITVVNVTSSPTKRGLERRQLDGPLTLTLAGGTLTDQAGRTGYIAANRQFQFDSPPQTGAVYTAGWSLCGNGSLALGGSAIFYQCLSGNFYNLYDQSQGGQCAAVYFVSLSGGSAPATATVASDGQPAASSIVASVSQLSDGQPQASTVVVSQISDGQPQATTGAAITQISDGQPQAPTAAPITQISDGQPQAPTGAPVTQISDGQVQASTAAAPVTQISDGQVQATTAAAPVTQISDGQVQATTAAAPVTQISDGQVQATTGAPVTQISDGQVQATTAGPAVTQISDGQIQAPTATAATIASFSGAADRNLAGSFAFAAGIVGAVAFL